MINRPLLLLALFLPLLLSGCNGFKAWYATEFRQGEVTSGIVRLSAQHLSMITSELGKKFKGPGVSTKIVKSDDPQEVGKGSVIRTIENAEINYPEEASVYKDCLGTSASWQGKVEVVNATQTIYGRLTNNPDNPVIPDPNGVKMTIHVKPHDSVIKFSDKPDHIQLDKGEISFDAYPRLAQSQDGALKGLRIVPTSNTRFENVVLKDISGTLVSSKVTLPFDISSSNFVVQVGKGENGEENRIDGEITAFGNYRKIPTDGHALNPDYDADGFMKTYSCNEGLKGVVEYKNVLFEEKMGPGMAGLTTMAMSKVASKLSDDYACGMASVAFLRATQLTGDQLELGYSSGALPGPCQISFQNFQTEPDCFGMAYEINGEANVLQATKVVNGLMFSSVDEFNDSIDNYENELLAGNLTALSKKPEPVLPKSRQPAVIEFTADLSNLTIREVCVHQGSTDHEAHCSKSEATNSPLEFSLFAGEVTAKLRPLMGKVIDPDDDRVHMCTAKAVPIADTEFRLKSVNASIKRAGNEFHLIADGAYRAISGKIDDHENELSGEVKIGRVPVVFRAQNVDYLPLKPDYDARRFEDSYLSCMQNKFVVPQSDDDCSMSELGL